MNSIGLSSADRPVVAAATARAGETGAPAVSIRLPDGTIVTGKTSSLLGAILGMPYERSQSLRA